MLLQGALLEACFRRRNGFGHLSQQDVDERRKERKAAYAKERARALLPQPPGQNSRRPSRDHDTGIRVLDFAGPHANAGARLAKKMRLKV